MIPLNQHTTKHKKHKQMISGKTVVIVFVIVFVSCFNIYSQDNVDLLILNKKYDAAITEIESQLKHRPSAQLWYKKGLIYTQKQNHKEALLSFSSALQLDPENVDVLAEMANGLAVMGNNLDAEGFYKKAIELQPENLVLRGKLGRIYINQKKTKKHH